MKQICNHKGILALLLAVVLLAASFGAELLWFQRDVMALDAAERVETGVSLRDLQLQDLELRETDGALVVTGENPTFSLPAGMFISRLQIGTNGQTVPMHVTVSDQDKVYDIHSTMKGMSILRVNEWAEDVRFGLTADGGETELYLDAVYVDNTLNINWLRIGLMVSIGLAVGFLLLFYRTAVTKLHISFLVLALTIGINMALATPTWYGLDEGAHYIRAYQFANFNLGFDHEEELDWIYDIENFFYYTGTVNAPHNTYDEREAFIDRYDDTEYGVSQYFPTTAATYPFVPYFFAGVGILLARLLGMPFVLTFYAGRVFNVLGYALICAFAIKTAKMGKRLLFMMSLLPYALFSAGVYTADTLTVSFAVLATALYLNMLLAEDGSVDYKLPVGFGLCVAAMAMCKLPYAPFCMLVLSVPLKKFRSTKQALVNFVLVFAVVGIISVATLLFGADKGIIQWYQPGMSITGQVKFMLTHPFQYAWIMLSHVLDNWKDYIYGSTMKMGYTGDMSGLWAAFATAVLALLALLDREEEAGVLTALPKLACVGTILCSWALVLTALYVSFNVVGAAYIGGVQGRYFYPLLLPMLLLLKNKRLALPVGGERLNAVCYMTAAVLGIAAVTHVFVGFCM